MSSLPVVCVFGVTDIELQSAGPVPKFETRGIDCRCYQTDDDLYRVLAENRPVVIVSFGNIDNFSNLMNANWEVRKKWLHYDSQEDLQKVGHETFLSFIYNATTKRDDVPLVTVFTPTYNTGEKIMRPYRSLRSQTFQNWEWVIMDDSDDNGETFSMLREIADTDFRIRVYKSDRHSGRIGQIKRDACSLARGHYLVEFDHDDEFTENALEDVVKAFQKHPECGFVYTDFAECGEDGTPVTYGQDLNAKPPFADWGLGYGSYRTEIRNGHKYMVANAPNINAKTIRHIVAAPNHIRAWRKSVYDEIGGHGDMIHVADDYEIMVRTFLHTRMCRVPKMCYVQYRNVESGNTHQERIKEIQRLVRYFSQYYDQAIHKRLEELGVDDFVWKDGENSFIRMQKVENPSEESHCTIILED